MAKKSKFKLPILHKDKNTNIALYVLIVGALIFIIWKLIKRFSPSNEAGEVQSTTGSTPSNPTPPKVVPITNETVFALKSPRMKNERVQWMQNAYNNYVNARKSLGKTPEWPTVSEDGVFGPATESAVNRIMGKKSSSWTAFKSKASYLTTELNKTSVSSWNTGSGGSW